MIILAFDIARNTGFAVGDSSGKPLCWSRDLGTSYERRFCSMLRITSELIVQYKPDLIVIEDTVGRARTPHVNVGIISCCRGVACDRKVPVKMLDVTTVRKHFIGRNPTKRDFPGMSENNATKEIKRMVMKHCQLRGWQPQDSDQADALALWDYACATSSRAYQSLPSGGLIRG